ncbi:MAG: hypothetical protein Q4A80_02930, partial [Bacillota bacterium]|nr:hypothetical protein [Bacillota bacterium]
AYFSFRGLHLSAPLIPREGGVFVSLLSVICEIIQTGVAVSALLLEVSERIGKKKGKDDREKYPPGCHQAGTIVFDIVLFGSQPLPAVSC